ncbi:MAG: class I tRNA ligase family protein, partial [Rhodospirillales bacterium]|nr:class I tRNA ligase family protein [Rhodospirillales bacterium]
TFAQIWMHNGYLMVEGEKMSKSLGNFITVHNLLKEHHGEAVRLCMLMTHYRQPLNWTADGLAQAKSNLDSFYGALRATVEIIPATVAPADNFVSALADDLNSPQAIAVLHELVGELNKAGNDKAKATAKNNLLAAGNLMGLLQLDPEDWFKWTPAGASDGLSDADIDALIEQRREARANKDFATSDQIRDDLAAQGIVLEDSANSTIWKRG